MKPGFAGLLHCSPVQLRGFRNNVGAKVADFYKTLRIPARIFLI